MISEFEDIRPYYDSEIGDAMERIINSPFFGNIVEFLHPGVPVDLIKEQFRTYKTVHSFQINVMDAAIQNIIKFTSAGLTHSGIERLDRSKRYLFLANHRDILLDSAILQLVLYLNQHETTEITFGDNLMNSQLIIDIGKSNKMFKLVRGGTSKEIFKNSLCTSKYIRYAITEKLQSVWIAHRSGRTKDGNDQTLSSVLKMFRMSGAACFSECFNELNVAPIVMSYEFEPCDFLKTRELYITRRQEYVKTEGEDLNSILTGTKQYKGGIHLAFAEPITLEELVALDSLPKNDQIQELALIVDDRIYKNYKLWKTNFIAYDVLYHADSTENYTSKDKADFIDYMKKGLSKIEGDQEELENIFLNIYANPVVNWKRTVEKNLVGIKILT